MSFEVAGSSPESGSRDGSRPGGLAQRVLRAGSRLGRRLAWRHYSTARAYYLTRLRLLGPPQDPIVVYTVGKVGSTTISRSLVASGVKRTIHHVHWLVPERLADCDAFYRAADRRHRGTARALRFRPGFVWLGQYVSRQIGLEPNRQWQVVTLVRDPLARNASAFFQNLGSFFDYWIEQEIAAKGVERVAQELVTLFVDAYVKGTVPTAVDGDPISWFEQELQPVFGVDVYCAPFPRHEGFEIYESANARVLVLRLEDLEACAERAFQRFLGLENYRPARSNVGERKPYAAVYKRFLELIRLPEEYLEYLYNSRYCTHFYTQSELAGFRARWRGERCRG
ncbi:MAG: putative capsular polysaccharide synthesis family protein [Gammaproteobacteria bacterium]